MLTRMVGTHRTLDGIGQFESVVSITLDYNYLTDEAFRKLTEYPCLINNLETLWLNNNNVRIHMHHLIALLLILPIHDI